jgi:hypothetical protein
MCFAFVKVAQLGGSLSCGVITVGLGMLFGQITEQQAT